ncbi:3-oxoacyl-[acyl-carrier-protein] synthase [Acetivibrio straminisolvens JCM 21531]|uniref:3-oxoacyl-[acyl-carrier-protein] synthase n=1 Tax=Acetivibrio straminisolvens JCM 21531 TaxID=1294263 RepID=W4V4Q9_9FIRM|nr:3-oxoacyl-[acyl-carrier-protein] synthase [Acetivibrio straminisolvens JCM 21531]
MASYFYSNYQYYDMAVMQSPLSLAENFSPTELVSAIGDLYKMENWKIAESFIERQ